MFDQLRWLGSQLFTASNHNVFIDVQPVASLSAKITRQGFVIRLIVVIRIATFKASAAVMVCRTTNCLARHTAHCGNLYRSRTLSQRLNATHAHTASTRPNGQAP